INLTGGTLTGGTGVRVQGNYIGTDVTGTAPLGNSLSGVFVDADTVVHTIDHNVIAGNGVNGIRIPNNNNPGVRISISANSIVANGGIGIDLGPPGDTPNDDKDLDGGANLQQNFPVLNAASTLISKEITHGEITPHATATVTVSGTFNSTPNQQFTLEFF